MGEKQLISAKFCYKKEPPTVVVDEDSLLIILKLKSILT